MSKPRRGTSIQKSSKTANGDSFATKNEVFQIVRESTEAIRREIAEATKNIKNYVFQIVQESTDAILEGQTPIYEKLKEHDRRFDVLERKVDKQGLEIKHVKDNIRGLTAELSKTPTRAEFEGLKRRSQN